jgi:ParB/RepB/Spo0J family partition protein
MTDTPETEGTAVPEETSAPASEKKAKSKPKAKTDVPVANAAPNTTWKLKDIILPEDWNREKLTNISGLAQSIKEVGLVTALSVRPSDNPNKVILVDGRRRYAALQEAKITEANVTVLPTMDATEAYLLALVANEGRESNNAYELAMAFEKLVADGKKNRDIAKAIDKTEGYISQHRAILRTPNYVQKAIKSGQLPPSATRILVKLNYEEDQGFYDKVAEAMIAGSISIEDAAEKIDLYNEKKAEKEAGEAKKGKKSAAKTKAEKKRGPALKIPDYADKDILKQMEPLPKTEANKYLQHFADRLLKTSSKVKSAYNQGVLHGIEISYKLRGE